MCRAENVGPDWNYATFCSHYLTQLIPRGEDAFELVIKVSHSMPYVLPDWRSRNRKGRIRNQQLSTRRLTGLMHMQPMISSSNIQPGKAGGRLLAVQMTRLFFLMAKRWVLIRGVLWKLWVNGTKKVNPGPLGMYSERFHHPVQQSDIDYRGHSMPRPSHSVCYFSRARKSADWCFNRRQQELCVWSCECSQIGGIPESNLVKWSCFIRSV